MQTVSLVPAAAYFTMPGDTGFTRWRSGPRPARMTAVMRAAYGAGGERLTGLASSLVDEIGRVGNAEAGYVVITGSDEVEDVVNALAD